MEHVTPAHQQCDRRAERRRPADASAGAVGRSARLVQGVSHAAHVALVEEEPGVDGQHPSVALYGIFGAEDTSLEMLRTGYFKYFEPGWDYIAGPVGLLSAYVLQCRNPLISLTGIFT
jgi:hypothetical protein